MVTTLLLWLGFVLGFATTAVGFGFIFYRGKRSFLETVFFGAAFIFLGTGIMNWTGTALFDEPIAPPQAEMPVEKPSSPSPTGWES